MSHPNFGPSVLDVFWKAYLREQKVGPAVALDFVRKEAEERRARGEDVPWWLQRLIAYYEKEVEQWRSASESSR